MQNRCGRKEGGKPSSVSKTADNNDYILQDSKPLKSEVVASRIIFMANEIGHKLTSYIWNIFE